MSERPFCTGEEQLHLPAFTLHTHTHRVARVFPAATRGTDRTQCRGRQPPTHFSTNDAKFASVHFRFSQKHCTCEVTVLILIHQIQIHTKPEGHFVLPFIHCNDFCWLR